MLLLRDHFVYPRGDSDCLCCVHDNFSSFFPSVYFALLHMYSRAPTTVQDVCIYQACYVYLTLLLLKRESGCPLLPNGIHPSLESARVFPYFRLHSLLRRHGSVPGRCLDLFTRVLLLPN